MRETLRDAVFLCSGPLVPARAKAFWAAMNVLVAPSRSPPASISLNLRRLVAKALRELQRHCNFVKVLGSYPDVEKTMRPVSRPENPEEIAGA